jgi:hypothetical protein
LKLQLAAAEHVAEQILRQIVVLMNEELLYLFDLICEQVFLVQLSDQVL